MFYLLNILINEMHDSPLVPIIIFNEDRKTACNIKYCILFKYENSSDFDVSTYSCRVLYSGSNDFHGFISINPHLIRYSSFPYLMIYT
jgi:hypothetical protein